MIRAVVNKGIIRPVDPLPADWQEGRVVGVDDLTAELADGRDDIETWLRDMNALTAELSDPDEWRAIQASLAEADRQSKEFVRDAKWGYLDGWLFAGPDWVAGSEGTPEGPASCRRRRAL